MTKEYSFKWKESSRNHRAFALIVDGKLTGAIYIPSIEGKFAANSEALASNPIVVEITNMDSHPDITEGYIWNGLDFDPPA